MESYSLHFERMSNVDLHPLSLPVSRLSPGKSNSSIVDQLTHHQHGKGDSAYSSFSGGSNAPDYSSSFLPEDLQSSPFTHYADLKFVKSIYTPTEVLQSDTKTMDQLYHSVEAISHQCHHTKGTIVNHHSNHCHTNNKDVCKQGVPLVAHPQGAYFLHPPPIPVRLDSYIATKNLDNNRTQHHGTESQVQQQSRPHTPVHGKPCEPIVSNPEMINSDSENSGLKPDPIQDSWRGLQKQQPQVSQPPIHLPHIQPHDKSRMLLNSEYLITDKKAVCEQQKSRNTLSRSPPRGTSQAEHLKSRQPASSSGCDGDGNKSRGGSSGSHVDNQRKRANSAYDWLGSELAHAESSCDPASNIINSSIQHKGQFYFVTGVCKMSEAGMRTYSASVCGSDAGSESSTVVETHRLRQKERRHSTMDNFFRPFSSDAILDEEICTSSAKNKLRTSRSHDEENHRPAFLSQFSQSFNDLGEIHMAPSREMGRHTDNNPIFYCGPDNNCSLSTISQKKELSSLTTDEHYNQHKRKEQSKSLERQPLGDVASERISKETTPLLYQLTSANRAMLKPKKDAYVSIKSREATINEANHTDVTVNDDVLSHGEVSNRVSGDINSLACNTLDDSFKKYYKEKLKDAQSRVLRETSFKRRDLQLSLPHCIRRKPEPRPTAIHAFFSSKDSDASADTLATSVISEETERGSMNEKTREHPKETDRESENTNGRPVNVAQPQVARIGGRKRLTLEQKKMSFSEPEKLNQIGAFSTHSACRSFENETENVFLVEGKGEVHVSHGEQGLVATRRKMFETRGRSLTAPGVSKTNLKHLQHKALVEYMERKKGQKVAEPQQAWSQLPPPPRQRHSLGEKPFDWGPKPLSGSYEAKSMKKHRRPHSAGRILDSSTSSVRYAQFFSAQSDTLQSGSCPSQGKRKEVQGPSQGKSASAENLLDQPEPPCSFRNRSTSSPHTFQALDYEKQQLLVNTVETWRIQKNATEDTSTKEAHEGQRHIRVVAQRGKSMEELGASKLTKITALSKSSEQLDQLWRHSSGPGVELGLSKDKRSVSFFAEVKEEKSRCQERWRKSRSVSEHAGKESEIVARKNPQEHTSSQMEKKPLLKQDSLLCSGEDAEPVVAGIRNLSRSSSPSNFSCSQFRFHSGSPESNGMVTDEFRSSNKMSNPLSPRHQETSELLNQKFTYESRPSSRVRTSSATGSEREQPNEPSSHPVPPDTNHEMSLSCGVTTEPLLWLPPPEEGIKHQTSPITDSTCDSVTTGPAPHMQTSETSVTPNIVSDADISPQLEEENGPEVEDENLEGNQVMEDRRTPEGETESLQGPTERPQWEELVEAVVKADQSLAKVLYPLANRKTALMLMEQLLSEDTLLMEEHYKKKQEQKGTAESANAAEGAESPPSPFPETHSPQCTELQNKADITEKKHLLVSHIKERLHSLEESCTVLQTDIDENVAHGEVLEELIREHCLPIELERYNLFIGDLERVVSLLLCLSARLARVQNALSTVDQHTDTEEKQSLDSRHRLLCKQREDAKDLKDNLDRRENLVSTFLSRQLSAEQLQDYRHFVQTKASLLIRQKDLEEKKRLAEEQLEALCNSVNL
ncbi:protein Shroom3 isoform X2 [Thalassophryne amazonica]|nr:protein Shroom3 isoform X2 [Thalassophryne amazonica]XP_034033913.1 protein Shroom3 isoform X2 [Thalassophryne amazonica]